jgi:hypothetical protein
MAINNTIDADARTRRKLATNIDNFRRRYSTTDSDKDVYFVSPSYSILDRFKYVLLNRSNRYDLEEKYYYRPDYLSFDQYGTTTLWPILLYINNVPSIEQFNISEVIIPDLSAITDLARYNDGALKPLDVEELNKEPTNLRLQSLYKRMWNTKWPKPTPPGL